MSVKRKVTVPAGSSDVDWPALGVILRYLPKLTRHLGSYSTVTGSGDYIEHDSIGAKKKENAPLHPAHLAAGIRLIVRSREPVVNTAPAQIGACGQESTKASQTLDKSVHKLYNYP